MYRRLKIVGLLMIVAGLVFVGLGGYAFVKAQDGARSLQAFSAAQDVRLTYNDQGQLTDRGKTEEAEAIMKLLTEDWGYPVIRSDLDPNDPVVNTASEYMYEMATITYHVINGTQTVTVADHTDYNDVHYMPGEYQFAVAGRYWSQFDRQDPVQGKAREQAWTGTAQALIAELGVGSVTASTLQLGVGVAGIAAALGATLVLLGSGLIWAVRRPTAD